MSLADRTPPTAEQYQAYRERLSNWVRWGEDDQLGAPNHITDETRRAAAGLVGEGRFTRRTLARGGGTEGAGRGRASTGSAWRWASTLGPASLCLF